ncbi:hypothetical protein OROGR_034294 [Orobanche gracilis]
MPSDTSERLADRKTEPDCQANGKRTNSEGRANYHEEYKKLALVPSLETVEFVYERRKVRVRRRGRALQSRIHVFGKAVLIS